MTASAIPRSRWQTCRVFRAPPASFADLPGGTVYGRERTEFFAVCEICGTLGAQKKPVAGRTAPA